MTKKECVSLARIIRAQRQANKHTADFPTLVQSYDYKVGFSDAMGHADREIDSFVNRLADMLAQDNPRFNREKFLSACEIE